MQPKMKRVHSPKKYLNSQVGTLTHTFVFKTNFKSLLCFTVSLVFFLLKVFVAYLFFLVSEPSTSNSRKCILMYSQNALYLH